MADFLQERGVIGSKFRNLPYPVASLAGVNDYGEILIVGTKYKLGKEAHFLAVASFCLHLVVVGGTEILQSLGVLALVEQHLVNYDDEFAVPVVVELAAEILVGVERDVCLEQQFEKIEEGGFSSVALL